MDILKIKNKKVRIEVVNLMQAMNSSKFEPNFSKVRFEIENKWTNYFLKALSLCENQEEANSLKEIIFELSKRGNLENKFYQAIKDMFNEEGIKKSRNRLKNRDEGEIREELAEEEFYRMQGVFNEIRNEYLEIQGKKWTDMKRLRELISKGWQEINKSNSAEGKKELQKLIFEIEEYITNIKDEPR